MKLDCAGSQDFSKLQENLIQRDKQERLALASVTTETLTQLNVTPDTLPQRCQDLLCQVSSLQLSLGVEKLDPVAISMRQSQEIAKKLEEEYELLELKQKNSVLDREVEKNKKVIDDLKQELQSSKKSLDSQNPNPKNVSEHVRQMKQKMTSYEEIYEKAKAKFSKLQVPEGILPRSIELLAQQLATLKEEEENLRQRAEEIELARKARANLHRLRK